MNNKSNDINRNTNNESDNNNNTSINIGCDGIQNKAPKSLSSLKSTKIDSRSFSRRECLAALGMSSICAPFLLLYRIEKRKQKRCTQLPLIFRQLTPYNDALCSLMTAVLLRSIRPSLFVGTNHPRFQTSSVSSNSHLIPLVKQQHHQHQQRRKNLIDSNKALFHREYILLDHNHHKVNNSIASEIRNGIHTIVLDWYISNSRTHQEETSQKFSRNASNPIILLVNIKNHDNNKYQTTNQTNDLFHQESTIQTCLKHGWILIEMSLRQITDQYITLSTADLSAPSMMNSEFLRITIQNIEQKLKSQSPSPTYKLPSLFLMGNSSFSNDMIVKYLGEEGLSKTLPSIVMGAITVGSYRNMESRGGHTNHPMRPSSSSSSSSNIRKYSSSYMYLPHVSIPLLQLITCNDDNNDYRYAHSSESNPNILTVNVEMGNDWEWHVSRKYGLSELYSALWHMLQANGRVEVKHRRFASGSDRSSSSGSGGGYFCLNNNLQKSTWADRVSFYFIKAILMLQKDHHSSQQDNRGVGMSKKTTMQQIGTPWISSKL